MNYSLAFLTLQECGPLEAIRAAAAAGYRQVGLRLMPATAEEHDYPLLTDDRLLREVRSLLGETGLAVSDVELVRLRPETDIGRYDRLFARAGELGARHVTAVNDDPVQSRFVDRFSRLCERAAQHRLTVDLEPMTWTATASLAQARAWIAAVHQPNAGILVDALHFHRNGSEWEALGAIPDAQWNMFQICDAPVKFNSAHDALKRVSRGERLLPGEGELDLSALVQRVPAHTTISVEVPNLEHARRYTPAQRARRALDSTKKAFEETRHAQPT